MQSIDIAPDEKECMQQLFFNGPTWDGDIVSKAGRAGLMRRGYVERENGWTQLSPAGFVVAVRAGLGEDKERRDSKRRRENDERHRALCGFLEQAGGSAVIGPGDPQSHEIEVTRYDDGSVRFAISDQQTEKVMKFSLKSTSAEGERRAGHDWSIDTTNEIIAVVSNQMREGGMHLTKLALAIVAILDRRKEEKAPV